MKVRPRSVRELQAHAELERRSRARAKVISGMPLVEAIPLITPRFDAPTHLQPLLDLAERVKRGEAPFALISVPPQHGKTETILHLLAQLLGIFPDRIYAYVTYAGSLSLSKSREAQKYAKAAGVRIDSTFNTMAEWRTVVGGGFLATSVGGQLTGQGVSGGLVIDDPFANREEAESQLIRDTVHGFFTSTAIPRVHPGAFVFIVHTRWHEDDLIGRLAKEFVENEAGERVPKWEVINLPAISEDGEALWPKRRPLPFLKSVRGIVGEYDWSALYQGNPRPKGNNVFRGVQYYDKLPNRYRIGKGLDLAYTASNRADYSAAIVIAECDGDIYVLDMAHRQSDVRGFLPELERLDAQHAGPWNFICSGIERAAIELAPTGDIDINVINASGDKFARAQPVAARWNGDPEEDVAAEDAEQFQELAEAQASPYREPPRKGRVFVPRQAAWLRVFLAEVTSFTGVGDAHDDIVDALAGAFWDFKEDAGTQRIFVPHAVSEAYRFPTERGF
jgi:hypothetical protein